MTRTSRTQEDIETKVVDLYFSMYALFLGLKYRLEIDLDMQFMKRSVNALRSHAKSPECKARLAILSGVLNCYETASVDTIVLRPVANVQRVDLFIQFVEDQTYLQLSRNFHNLGYPDRLKRSITLIGRLAKKLIAEAPFKQVIDVSSRIISAASSLPLPDSELGASLMTKKYLPPVVPVRQAMNRAKEAWEKADTPFVPLR